MEEQSSLDWKRLALFFALSLALFVGWQYLFPPPRQVPPVPPIETPVAEAPPPEAPADVAEAAPAALESVAETVARRATVTVGRARVELTNVGGRITSWKLLDHGEYGSVVGQNGEVEPLDIVRRPLAPPPPEASAEVEPSESGPGPARLPIDDDADMLPLQVFTGRPGLDETLAKALHVIDVVDEADRTTVTLSWADGRGTAVEKRLLFAADTPAVVVEASLLVDGRPVPFHLGWGPGIGNPTRLELNNSYFRRGEVIYRAGGKIEKVARADKPGDFGQVAVDWAGLEESYFCVVFVPAVPGAADAGAVTGFSVRGTLPLRADGKKTSKKEWADALVLAAPFGPQIPAQTLYVGPRSREALAAIDASLPRPRGLAELTRSGLLEPIAAVMKSLLVWFHDRTSRWSWLDVHVGAWGVAILLLTITIRLAMFPLTHVSLKRMRSLQERMQAFKPKQDALKEKFRKLPRTMENRQREQQELMEMYAAAGIKPGEPLLGCLPLLLSMPFFMALFYMLPREIALRQQPFLWWTDLALPDPSHVLPILSGVTTFVSSKLSTTSSGSMDPMQKNMLYVFPVMFTWICWEAPLGLVVYWTASNVIQIGQQYLLKLTLPQTGAAPTQGSPPPRKEVVSRRTASATPDAALDRSSAELPPRAAGAKKRRKR